MSAYMKPRMMPSRSTSGKIRTSSSRSMLISTGRGRGVGARPESVVVLRFWTGPDSPAPSGLLLLEWRRCDGEALGFLVVSPLLGVVAGHLHDVVRGLLRVALVVELDGPGHARVLDLPDGACHGGARRHLAAGHGGLDRLERNRGGHERLGRVGLGILAELLLEVVAELLGLRARGRRRRRRVVEADEGLAADLHQVG